MPAVRDAAAGGRGVKSPDVVSSAHTRLPAASVIDNTVPRLGEIRGIA